MSQDVVERMRSGDFAEGLTPAEHALVRYVRKVAAGPPKITQADIDELKSHGWDNQEIVEALAMSLLSAFTNTLAQAMHFEDDLEPLGMKGYF